MDTNRKGLGEGFRKALRRQGGFTLIELVAVMAILGILVAVVAPAVTNTQKASVRAQAQADSSQVRNAANDFFKDQEESEVTIPHTVDVTADDDSGAIASTAQRVSTRWPEIFITEDTGSVPTLTATRSANAKYSDVFPTSTSTGATGVVAKVTLEIDASTNLSVDGTGGLLDSFTAIDLNQLVTEGFLSELPAAESRKSNAGNTGGLEVPNFLWLFEKTDSSGGTDDARDIVVFELVNLEQNEDGTATGGGNTVNLTYEQIQ